MSELNSTPSRSFLPIPSVLVSSLDPAMSRSTAGWYQRPQKKPRLQIKRKQASYDMQDMLSMTAQEGGFLVVYSSIHVVVKIADQGLGLT